MRIFLKYIKCLNLLDNIRSGPRRDNGERQTKSNEVRPLGFNEGEPFVQLPAHVKPLVFKCIQRVEKTHVDHAENFTQWIKRHRADQHCLQQEEGLHKEAEEKVCYGFTDTRHHDGPASRVSICRISNILEEKQILSGVKFKI